MRLLPMFAVVVLGCLAVPAFAQDNHSAASHGAAPATTIAREKSPPDAKVFFISPQDGAHVGQDVTVNFGVEGMHVLAAGEMKAGSGHHHLLIDTSELPPLDAPIPTDANHRHYGKGQTGDTIHLKPGTHTLQLDFGDARHMQFDPPLVSKKITIHVE